MHVGFVKAEVIGYLEPEASEVNLNFIIFLPEAGICLPGYFEYPTANKMR